MPSLTIENKIFAFDDIKNLHVFNIINKRWEFYKEE